MAGSPAALAELHVHLEGSITDEALIEIEPSLTPEEIRENTRFDSFPGFLQSYIWVNRKLRTPQHYAIAARRLLERFSEQSIHYAEVTLSAGMVLWKEQQLAEIYDAIWRESLRSSVQVFWILDAIRHFGAEHGMAVARFAASRTSDGVVAFGIGGDELRGPAEWFKEVFAYSRDNGLHLVCHAGETGGPESVRAAVDIGAERIGHGIAAVRDTALMADLRRRHIPLEICITSNLCTGGVASMAEHPVRNLYEAGIPITLNTDDPALFHTTLEREYDVARTQFGFLESELDAVRRNAFRYAFRASGQAAIY